MSISRLLALLATSTHITPVIKFVGACLGSSAPYMNCGILLREPVGVMLVRPVLLAAMSVSSEMSGMAVRP